MSRPLKWASSAHSSSADLQDDLDEKILEGRDLVNALREDDEAMLALEADLQELEHASSSRVVKFLQSHNFKQKKESRLLEFKQMGPKNARRRLAHKFGLGGLLRWIEWYESIHEPDEFGWSSRIVKSPRFGHMSSAVILLNTAFIAYASNSSMKNQGVRPPTGIMVAEVVFVTYYAVELLLRIEANRWYFFGCHVIKWNLFDLTLVCLSVWDVFVSLHVDGDGSSNGNVSFMRIFRLLKLAKILRTLRIMKVFEDLAIMLESFYNGFIVLFWCFLMLAFMLFVFALIFLQGMTGYLEDVAGEIDADFKQNIMTAFGSLSRTMLTLYMAVTGGADWGEYFDMVAKAGPIYAFLFLFYTFFFNFAVLNILTGVFVEKAVAVAQPDMEERILQKRRLVEAQSAELRLVLQSIDSDCSGTISRSEFDEQMTHPLFVSYLSSLGLEVQDAALFFDLLVSVAAGSHYLERNAQDSIEIDSFVQGCLNLKGAASSIDMQRQLAKTHEIQKRLDKVADTLCSSLDKLSQKLLATSNPQTAGEQHDTDGIAHATMEEVSKVDSTVVVDECVREVWGDRQSPRSDQCRDTAIDAEMFNESIRKFWTELREELSAQLIPQLSTSIAKAVEPQLRASAESFVAELCLPHQRHDLAFLSESSPTRSGNGWIKSKAMHAASSLGHGRMLDVCDSRACAYLAAPQDASKDAVELIPEAVHQVTIAVDSDDECFNATDDRKSIESGDGAHLKAASPFDNGYVAPNAETSNLEALPPVVFTPLLASLPQVTCERNGNKVDIPITGSLPSAVLATVLQQHSSVASECAEQSSLTCPIMPECGSKLEEDSRVEHVKRASVAIAVGGACAKAAHQVPAIQGDTIKMRPVALRVDCDYIERVERACSASVPPHDVVWDTLQTRQDHSGETPLNVEMVGANTIGRSRIMTDEHAAASKRDAWPDG